MSDYTFALLFAIALVFLTVSYRRLVLAGPNPVLAHNVSWAVALAIYSLHWVAYTDVSTSAWVAIVSGILSFNVGALLPIGLRMQKRTRLGLTPSSLTWATTVLPVLFAIGAILYLRACCFDHGPE